MTGEKIKEWIRKKLEKGIEEDRIKQSLRNTGHDPSLVDEVISDKEDPFKFSDRENDLQDRDTSFSSSDKHEGTDESGGTDFSFSSTGKEESEDSSYRLSLPEVSESGETLAILGMSVIIAIGMAGVFSLVETSEVFQPQCSGDEGVGVKVYNVEAENGVTTAEVRVVEEVNVVLEVFESGNKIAENVEMMSGRGTISVNAVGDRISFHEYGCDSPSVERNY